MAMVQVLVPHVRCDPVGWTIMIECTNKHVIHLLTILALDKDGLIARS